MAKAKVEMLLGIYKWPDGRQPMNPNGTPKLSDRELLRVGGYTETYKDYKTKLFGDEYFESRVRIEMAAREKRDGVVLYDPSRVSTLRNLIFDELEARLEEDPGQFTRSELLTYAEKFELLSRHHEGNGKPPVSDKMNQFNAFISRTVNVMDSRQREQLVDAASEAAEDRIANLQKMIDLANVVEEEADDADVIDAEAVAVSD